MINTTIDRPEATEYPVYHERYISLVPQGDIIRTLEDQLHTTLELLHDIPETKEDWRYAPGKWSTREVVGHIIDTERIFAYRALRFARGDQTPLPAFEQDDYVRRGSFDDCKLSDLAREFGYVRQGNLCLFRHLRGEAWQRSGVASNTEVSVRALAYIIAGHELHHINILKTRYLSTQL